MKLVYGLLDSSFRYFLDQMEFRVVGSDPFRSSLPNKISL
jgi:hypothetical protein